MHMLSNRTMDPEELVIQSNKDVHVWFIYGGYKFEGKYLW